MSKVGYDEATIAQANALASKLSEAKRELARTKDELGNMQARFEQQERKMTALRDQLAAYQGMHMQTSQMHIQKGQQTSELIAEEKPKYPWWKVW